MKYIFSIALLMFLPGCVSDPSSAEKLKLYNDALSQIIFDNYYQHCLMLDEKTEKIQSDFYAGKVDTASYLKIGDSLKTIRKNTSPKCVLDYTNEFQIFTRGHVLGDDVKSSIAESLKNNFLTDYFGNTSTKIIIDTLSQPAQLSAKDLAVNYLEIIHHIKRPHSPYGDGMGVIGFSRIYFNKKTDKAILYYEFNCGPKCGTGEVVFLVKTKDKWKVEKYNRVSDS